MESKRLEELKKKIGGKIVKVIGCCASFPNLRDGKYYAVIAPKAHATQKDMIKYACQYGLDAYIDASICLCISRKSFEKFARIGEFDNLPTDMGIIDNIGIHEFADEVFIYDDTAYKIIGLVCAKFMKMEDEE